MDTSAPDIVFFPDGGCSFCRSAELVNSKGKSGFEGLETKSRELESLVRKLKIQGRGKRYDCVVGISGGLDSSWVLVKAVELGLRPLAVHMDNGWNSNLAVSNIESLLEALGVDLITYVIKWTEYRDLMQAFFDADVVDVELLYDNALHEVCYSQARRYGLRTILTGVNQSTEGVRVPRGWAADSKWDGENISRIARRSGVVMRTYPLFTTLKWLWYTYVKKIEFLPFLDYFSYTKSSALEELESKYKYSKYPYKHYESVFTRFFQGYLLLRKFGIDKRKVHFSSLIVSGQLSRDEALFDLEQSPYPDEIDLKRDMKFFLKKMNWSLADLEAYLARPAVSHGVYGSDKIRITILFILKLQAKLGIALGVMKKNLSLGKKIPSGPH
jgi:N-acetyl sugar amidotransferase